MSFFLSRTDIHGYSNRYTYISISSLILEIKTTDGQQKQVALVHSVLNCLWRTLSARVTIRVHSKTWSTEDGTKLSKTARIASKQQCLWHCDIYSINFSVRTKQIYSTFTVKCKVKVHLVQALRLCTGCTAHRGSRGIALLYRHWGSVQAVRPIAGVEV